MKRICRYFIAILGEVFILSFFLLLIRTYGENLLWYFYDGRSLLGTIVGIFIIVFISGHLYDFVNAFRLSVDFDDDVKAGKRSLLALKCAMISSVTISAFITIVGIVVAQNDVYLAEEGINVKAEIYAICASQPTYGLMIVLLLIPIYYRLKTKIEIDGQAGEETNV